MERAEVDPGFRIYLDPLPFPFPFAFVVDDERAGDQASTKEGGGRYVE
jgi:hypothetical protein